jgi:hypothetical protein
MPNRHFTISVFEHGDNMIVDTALAVVAGGEGIIVERAVQKVPSELRELLCDEWIDAVKLVLKNAL